MKSLILSLALICASATSVGSTETELARWQSTAKRVTIVRDDWGIAHVYGKTDADVVFGAMYAQAEDDFNRIETNYINSQGRLSEAEGESQIYRDLRMKLFIHPDSMKAKYKTSPAWLKTLMNAYADGLNFYLHTHPQVKPRLITRFEPWMALTFSEGSIGGDIEGISTRELEAFYGPKAESKPATDRNDEEDDAFKEPGGSNGFAIAPSNTANHKALLWINPHTSFFFRSELQMVSEEGLNAYGASTWGQFFIYQGFNDKAGWMHTTSGVDAVDEYLETVEQKNGKWVYRYNGADRPLTATKVVIPYRTNGGMASREFTVFRTHHGPVVRQANGKWVSVRLMQEPVKALTQSYSRTKAKNYKEFRKTMDLHTNSSNNTIFADAQGNIAYFHANFIPKRDTQFNWRRPVDGSDPRTEWKGGLHTVEESPHILNPKSGWLYNVNNWPFTASGESSPKKENYPAYMETGGENARGVHAIRVLSGKKDFTRESLMAAAFDSYMPAFDDLLPPLFAAYDAAPDGALKTKVARQVAMLRAWDRRWSAESVPTTLATFWGEELQRAVAAEARAAGIADDDIMATRETATQRLQALATVTDRLVADFGKWEVPWGDVNRFQRLTGDIVQPFNDAGASIPVPFASARWGSLASFGARRYPGTKKMYGTSGNSFLAVVEFGDSVRARAVSAGGENGDPKSPHFNDQAQRYASGNLRDVYFYKSQLKGHTERTYHPGE